MTWIWADYSGNDNEASLPLLISLRTQHLLLSALVAMRYRNMWSPNDDTTWDEIEAQLAETHYEITTEVTTVSDNTPVGVIAAFVGTSGDIPDKWLACLGSNVPSESYPELYAIIPSEYRVGDGTFYLPNLGSRFLYGASVNTDVTDIGGEANVTLTIAQMPSHNHGINARTATGTSPGAATSGTPNTSISTAFSGGGESHNNMPPYLRHYYIIKALP